MQAREGGCWKVESARVQRQGCIGTSGRGWRTVQRGGIHPRSIPGVAALTVKGVLRYEGAREKAGERRRGRMRDSDEFRILETLSRRVLKFPVYIIYDRDLRRIAEYKYFRK